MLLILPIFFYGIANLPFVEPAAGSKMSNQPRPLDKTEKHWKKIKQYVSFYCLFLSILRYVCALYPASTTVHQMARGKHGRRTLDSCAVKHIHKTIRPGDCVLMRPADSSKPSYVARVEKIEADSRGANVRVHVRWYYRPEESIGGRRQFHGSKEVFLSDHFDIQSVDTIEGKCTVHNFKNYTKLDAVGNDDYFCRFEYNSCTGAFNPDRVAVYCKCEMPYNPDDLMVQCEGCTDWFHPTCIDMTAEEAKRIDHFYCYNCSVEDQKKLEDPRISEINAEVKVNTKRRR